jgi:hypothetical protein
VKKILSASLLVLLLAGHVRAQRQHVVRPYVKKNGTVVQQHHQTNPNGTQRDNYSATGNVNPYTGKAGTKVPKK